MNTEKQHSEKNDAIISNNIEIKEIRGNALEFLKSLTPNVHSDKRSKNFVIDKISAKNIVDNLRNIGNEEAFTIPISWSMSKTSLINLLGITSYTHYAEINALRFYAGINNSGELTIVAVSTKASTDPLRAGMNDDLTEDDNYPYFDYADPCPNNCSGTGNLKHEGINPPVLSFKKA